MNPMQPINIGFWVSAIAATVGFIVVSYYIFHMAVPIDGFEWWRFAAACFTGIVLALAIGKTD
jgi:hypothetical protein